MARFRFSFTPFPSSLILVIVVTISLLLSTAPSASAGRKLRKNSLLYFIDTPLALNSLPRLLPRFTTQLQTSPSSSSSSSSSSLSSSSSPSSSSLFSSTSYISASPTNHLFTANKTKYKKKLIKAPLTKESRIFRLPTTYLSNGKTDKIISKGARKPVSDLKKAWIKSVDAVPSLLLPSVTTAATTTTTTTTTTSRPLKRKESKIFQMPLRYNANGRISKLYIKKKSKKEEDVGHNWYSKY